MDNSLLVSWLQDVYRQLFAAKKVETQEDFGNKLGYNKTYFSELMTGRKNITNKVRNKISEVFGIEYDAPDTEGNTSIVNEPDSELQIKEGKKKEVTLLGKHSPLRITADQYSEAFGDWKGLPMYNVPVTATFVETYRDETVYQPQYYLHDPRFRDCDFGAIITGDSMHSEIRHGDFIACKEIKDKRFIVFGDIYYVVATNGLETCKYLNVDQEDKSNFMLIAKNANISPSPIPKDMILRLYKVRGIIRGY